MSGSRGAGGDRRAKPRSRLVLALLVLVCAPATALYRGELRECYIMSNILKLNIMYVGWHQNEEKIVIMANNNSNNSNNNNGDGDNNNDDGAEGMFLRKTTFALLCRVIR